VPPEVHAGYGTPSGIGDLARRPKGPYVHEGSTPGFP